MAEKVGYARVSRRDQDPSLQEDELRAAGCSRVYWEKESGAKTERPELGRALDYARPGDTLVVWKLDRFGRSLKDLIVRVEELQERGGGATVLAGEHRHQHRRGEAYLPSVRSVS